MSGNCVRKWRGKGTGKEGYWGGIFVNIDNRYEEIVYSRYKVRVNDMAILEVDEGFEKILGFTAADVRERNLSVQDIILEEDWEEYYRIVYSKMGSTGEAYLGHRLRKKNGEVIFVFCFGWVSHIDANGDIYGDVLITDITKTKNMREQLKNLEGINSELNHELADKNRMQESILNNVGGGVGVFDIRNKQILVQYISESFFICTLFFKFIYPICFHINRICKCTYITSVFFRKYIGYFAVCLFFYPFIYHFNTVIVRNRLSISLVVALYFLLIVVGEISIFPAVLVKPY